jgi:hypothetical protein
MEIDMSKEGVELFIVLLCGMILGILFGVKAMSYVYELDAVKNGCAQYNPKTAKFEWINKISEDKSVN